MFELLFVIGLIGLVLVQLGEWAASTPYFVSLLILVFASPLIYVIEYERIRFRLTPQVLASARPLPPERFYWEAESHRMLRQMAILPILGAIGWTLVLQFPSESYWNWLGILLALIGTAPTLARISLYLSISQHFNRMKPNIVGWLRRLMVRFSDNPDYYDNQPDPEKSQKPLIY